MKKFIREIHTVSNLDFGHVSKTFAHEDILHRGVHRAVVKYFYERKGGDKRIKLNKIDKDYLEIKQVYFDFYGFSYCDLGMFGFRKVLSDLKINVEIVDFDEETKDMPYAHFDAETFYKSNERVIRFTDAIYEALNEKDYETARQLTGQVLHTIQDFYSHSNWVEMGKTEINKEIGKRQFSTMPIIEVNEPSACISNCTLVESHCSGIVTKIVDLLHTAGLGKTINCPLTYYKCKGNLIKLNKLVSGHYEGQKLEDGTDVPKPKGKNKCSHGM